MLFDHHMQDMYIYIYFNFRYKRKLAGDVREYRKSLPWLAGRSGVVHRPSPAATCKPMVSPVSMTVLEL